MNFVFCFPNYNDEKNLIDYRSSTDDQWDEIQKAVTDMYVDRYDLQVLELAYAN